MYLSVIAVEPLDEYKLLLTFENGEHRLFDVAPLLRMGKFAELTDTTLFNTVKIAFDSIQWDNQLDLDPEYLYERSTARD